MRTRIVLVAAALGLAVPGTAQAGCWATVQLSSLPDGVRAGGAWTVDLTVKQHGVRLLPNAKPTVTIVDADGRRTVFRARKTARTGVYRARVVFPEPGKWKYRVFDGFLPRCGHVHTYPSVTVKA